MRSRLRQRFVVLAWAISLAQPAEAQTHRIFAGAGVIADNDQTNSSLTDHAARSWTLVLGLDVSPHIGFRIAVDAPRAIRTTAEGVVTESRFEPPYRYRMSRTRRSTTYALLADAHVQIAQRVRVAVTCGLATVTHDSETLIVREELRPDGGTVPLPDLRDVGDHDWSGFPIGFEVSLLVSRRLEVVPEIRTIYFPLSDSPHPYIIRPGIGLRWRF